MAITILGKRLRDAETIARRRVKRWMRWWHYDEKYVTIDSIKKQKGHYRKSNVTCSCYSCSHNKYKRKGKKKELQKQKKYDMGL